MGKSSELFMQMQEQLAYIENQNEEGNYSNLDALLEFREYRSGAENIIEIIKLFENNKMAEISRDAAAYNGRYNGFHINEVSGRKTYDFENIPEWQVVNKSLKDIQEKYKSMYVAKANGNPHANISEDGEELPMPELKIGKSFITVKKI